MLKVLLAIPPIISVTHVFLAILLFSLNIKYSGSLLLLFALPVVLVVLIHIYIAITNSSMTKSEHLGYALVHIPFSISFSFLALLLFIPNNEYTDVEGNSKNTLLMCAGKSDIECLNNFSSRR